MEINAVTGAVVDSAMKVHTELGAGLLEHVYEACLKHELEKRGLRVKSQLAVPVAYDGLTFDIGFRVDILVEDAVVVELKAVEKVLPVHSAQLLTCLKLLRKPVGLLVNFNVPHLRDGITRLAN